MTPNALYYGDNLDILREYIPHESVDPIYLDPLGLCPVEHHASRAGEGMEGLQGRTEDWEILSIGLHSMEVVPMALYGDKYRGSREYLLVYAELIGAARYRGTITYQEIAGMIGLPSSGSHMGREIGQLLGEIAQEEHQNGRPMLTAIAVGVSGEPGPGFFRLARELGKLEDSSREGERELWVEEMAAVYHAWQRGVATPSRELP